MLSDGVAYGVPSGVSHLLRGRRTTTGCLQLQNDDVVQLRFLGLNERRPTLSLAGGALQPLCGCSSSVIRVLIVDVERNTIQQQCKVIKDPRVNQIYLYRGLQLMRGRHVGFSNLLALHGPFFPRFPPVLTLVTLRCRNPSPSLFPQSIKFMDPPIHFLEATASYSIHFSCHASPMRMETPEHADWACTGMAGTCGLNL
ncbi:predicted protein [Pyrenophora tritici-repentis Pt-1C-BFP]|uniref:Uncharacterized protein n=1 Tax=Pyrenophora tritici-repentis (strain Pt-1C-BFP) TaxID=426418 RepID=B2WPU5_PYRTR|nr:uncharacterized protein PTRG_12005 [Pyrenophora tritici-repentis Pt-1C-BFP]EDU46161.1 predicted protein [Pyrenophora tritici-repentis Pt-1C-BFP]